jgi:uncharacterized protein
MAMNKARAKTTTTIQVKAKPNARTSTLEEISTGVWQAQLKSPPVDGKANKELIGLVAERFGCPKSAVSIKSGGSGRLKRVCIEGF